MTTEEQGSEQVTQQEVTADAPVTPDQQGSAIPETSPTKAFDEMYERAQQELGEKAGTPAEPQTEVSPPEPEGSQPEPTQEQPAEQSNEQANLDELTKDIPPHLWRAAMWQRQFNGLAPQELAEFWQKDPAEAEKHFHGYHEAMNRANAQAAELGRQHREEQVRQLPNEQQQATTPPSLASAEELAEQFDVPMELASKLVDPLQNAMSRVEALEQQLTAQNEFVQQQQMASLWQSVEDFFTQGPMKSFPDFYGDKLDVAHLNPNVLKVMQEADDYRAGKQLQGIDVPLADALQVAHDMVTAPLAADAIRQKIRSDLTQRAQGVTHKPSHRVGQPVVSDEAKEQRVAEALSKV